MNNDCKISFGKYIIYVDESGDHSLSSIDQKYPLFVLAFCVFHQKHYSEKVVSELEKFKFKHFGHDQIILHEHEIRKEIGDFSFFRTRKEKLDFIDELTTIIQHSNFILISCVIDKRSLAKDTTLDINPYNVALGFCMEKLFEFLQEKNDHRSKTHIIVESRGKKENRDLELEFRRICDGNNRINVPMPFEILFSDKKTLSTGLQLADLVARPIGINILRPHQGNRAFNVLKKKFYCEGGRDFTGKGYIGQGLNIYPGPQKAKSPNGTH